MVEIAFAICMTAAPLNAAPPLPAPAMFCAAPTGFRYSSYPDCVDAAKLFVRVAHTSKNGFVTTHFYCVGIPNEEVAP